MLYCAHVFDFQKQMLSDHHFSPAGRKRKDIYMKFHKNKRSLAALIGVAALVLLYLAALITAFLNIPSWDKLFQASIVATIGVPILLWVYLLLIQGVKNRQADAYSADSKDSQPAQDEDK